MVDGIYQTIDINHHHHLKQQFMGGAQRVPAVG
jgi:hypothetical protein